MPGRLDAKRASRILGPPSGYRKWRGHPLVRAFDERATAALKDSDRALKRAAGVARITVLDGGVVLHVGADEARSVGYERVGCFP